MRRLTIAVVALLLLPPWTPVTAQDDVSKQLVGSWRVLSFKVQIIGESAEPRDMLGPQPFGRLILTAEHYMAVYISRLDRKPPTSEIEAAALLSSMNAYTGKFRIESDKFITKVDGAWNEIFKAREQVRFFKLEDDKLTIWTPEQPSATLPGKRVISTLLWERER
jgi:hypothetical protein